MSDASLPTNHDIGFDVSPGTTYPSTFSTPIEFANPDSMLSGTLRGTQFVGSNTLQIDSTQNLITIKNSAAALNQTGVLRVGTVAQNYLGMAVNNGTVDTMFAGQDSTGATVVKVAKAGYDAKTATNDQLIFNSAQNILKVQSATSAVQLLPNTANTVAAGTYTYNVPFTSTTTKPPAIIAYFATVESIIIGGRPIFTGTSQGLPYFASTGSTNVASVFYEVLATSVTFYFVAFLNIGFNSTPSVTYNYYILQETIG